MKALLRTAALLAAFVLVCTMSACGRNEAAIAESLDAVKESCKVEAEAKSGEICIYKTIKLDTDIEGIAQNSSIETYIKYVNETGDPDFALTETTKIATSNNSSTRTFEKEGELMLELVDGVGNFATEAPDIFEELHANFEVQDVESSDVVATGYKGIKEYKFVMTSEYANSFDTERDGAVLDCIAVKYTYSIDGSKDIATILREYTYTITYDGQSQTLVEVVDVKPQ